jgi:hypothetical protein
MGNNIKREQQIEQVSASLDMLLTAMEDGEKAARSGRELYDLPVRQPRSRPVSSVGSSMNLMLDLRYDSETSLASDGTQSSL